MLNKFTGHYDKNDLPIHSGQKFVDTNGKIGTVIETINNFNLSYGIGNKIQVLTKQLAKSIEIWQKEKS